MSSYLAADEIASQMARRLRHCNLRLDGAAERVLAASGDFTAEQIRQHVQQAIDYERARRAALHDRRARPSAYVQGEAKSA